MQLMPPRVQIRLVREESTTTYPDLSSPLKIATAFKWMVELDREELWGIYLDSKLMPNSTNQISVGTLDASLVHPREVFKPAILANARSLVLCHNHPSGNPSPSDQDHQVTTTIREAGKLLGIELLDSLIIGQYGYWSLSEGEEHPWP